MQMGPMENIKRDLWKTRSETVGNRQVEPWQTAKGTNGKPQEEPVENRKEEQ